MLENSFIPENGRGLAVNVQGLILKTARVIPLCMIVELPAALKRCGYLITIFRKDKKMKRWIFVFGLILSIFKQSLATIYIPCGEKNGDADGNCWPCGDECSARLTYPTEQDKTNHTNATLTFSGKNAMYGYDSPFGNPELTNVEPWYSVRNQIVKVVVEDGITSVGTRAIYDMGKLREVSLPDSIESIGYYGFYITPSLQSISIPENVKEIYGYAFKGANFTSLSLPASLFQQDGVAHNNILLNSEISALYCPKQYEQKCRQILEGSGFEDSSIENILKFYAKSGDEYFYDGRFYKNAADIAKQSNIKKRIYTIDEANRVAGDKNRVSIKYR